MWRRSAVALGMVAAMSCMARGHTGAKKQPASRITGALARTFVSSTAFGAASSGKMRAASARPRMTRRSAWEDAAAASLGDDMSWTNDPVVSCVGWFALISGLTVLKVATSDDLHTPSAFLKQGGGDASTSAEAKQPVICLGDSLTRCNLSADWVSALRQQLQDGVDGSTVLNAGINMQCSNNIHQRIDEVVACRPSHVTVLVGTNDLKAELSPIEGFMYKVFGRLPEVPTLDSYEKTLLEIREKLLAAGAQVALVSPPVLGEDIGSESNKRASEFAAVVKKVAETAGDDRCSYLPLFEQTYAKLPQDGGRPYCGINFFAWCCLLCWDVHILQRDLGDIQRERKLGVTIDLVHLGPEAADNLAAMVHDFVRQAKGPKLAEAF